MRSNIYSARGVAVASLRAYAMMRSKTEIPRGPRPIIAILYMNAPLEVDETGMDRFRDGNHRIDDLGQFERTQGHSHAALARHRLCVRWRGPSQQLRSRTCKLFLTM